jgi:hypothetical protein
MKKTIYGICFVLIAFIASAQTTTNDWSKRIASKTQHTLESIISPHVNPINVLIIDGKRFEHVRGLKKFYLQVPKTDSIVFVTDDNNYRPTYHIFNMDTDEDMAIQSQSSMSSFGEDIGSLILIPATPLQWEMTELLYYAIWIKVPKARLPHLPIWIASNNSFIWIKTKRPLWLIKPFTMTRLVN